MATLGVTVPTRPDRGAKLVQPTAAGHEVVALGQEWSPTSSGGSTPPSARTGPAPGDDLRLLHDAMSDGLAPATIGAAERGPCT